jgi:hypothetical protein
MAPLDAQYARLSPTDDDVQVESKIALCECASMDQYRPKRSYGLTLLCANIIICATTLCALGWILALQKSPEDVDSAKMISAYCELAVVYHANLSILLFQIELNATWFAL